MSGRSHVVRMMRGVEIMSEKNMGENVVLVKLFCRRRVKLTRLIRKLCDEVLIHINFLFDNQVRGISIIDGKIIFSIVVD